MTDPMLAPHPGENHEFRTVCRRCGENGYLHVGVITDREVVRIEPRDLACGCPPGTHENTLAAIEAAHPDDGA